MILSDDRRQHGPVEVSDALRAIERNSGLHGLRLLLNPHVLKPDGQGNSHYVPTRSPGAMSVWRMIWTH